MEYLYEKVSYLRGLAEGLDIEEDSNEGKLLLHIIDTLEDFADAIVDLGVAQEEISEYVEAIDEDLSDVEDEIYFDYDDECQNCEEEFVFEED
ncbi:hypothetical protein Curi_c13710 [Gottschalkia acidurici 9a]|uniref:Uncharacterized protein n=1 Tax=Gottschalkia acidurici (strain ATCC 7906 / DSM 604 / BCRC 14475 / CIP 104303 / KCTC 5404 / NCIMB 10678 / 9a) TaxID=1128398 RepID=K0B169_GOTA9|nr:CD1247 N-terminal domain-containing protein [Gottschalkia acidurici]AFS78381.1 hypothetical protein Curi_c13710 [Gottschalkia acidurici 9a]